LIEATGMAKLKGRMRVGMTTRQAPLRNASTGILRI
jgi:hypothetical protein